MKLPAVAIATAFASGIALGFWPVVAKYVTAPVFLAAIVIVAGFFIIIAVAGALKSRLGFSWGLSLAAWLLLGIGGAGFSLQPEPPTYILNLINSGAIDLHSPLRWHGTLRDEPATLPWGISYDIALVGVDYQERSVALNGGIRATYSSRGVDSPPNLHAGDQIAIVAQARLPQRFQDEGAFDRRAYLRSQGVELTAQLRSSELIERVSAAEPSGTNALARLRHRLRENLSALFSGAPQETAVLRAMLLGDRSFLDRTESVDFQKTGVFHVLVVAGLHVGAFAAFLFWLARKLSVSRLWTSLLVLLCVVAFVVVVEQRPPVLRAALMTMLVVLALIFFRRVELLNSVAVAALLLLIASPALIVDSSFQLSFLAMFCIAALAMPWLANSVELYARGLRGWRDVTRDVSHPPRIAQFRIDLRSVAAWVEGKLPARIASRATQLAARSLGLVFRVWEMIVLTVVLQIGMLPLLARDFHRVALSGPLANLIAVPITGILVPLGFVTLAASLISFRIAAVIASPLRWLTALLLHMVSSVARVHAWSYRIPAPPFWLLLIFFVFATALAITHRLELSSSLWHRRVGFALLLIAASLIAIYPFAPRWRRGSLELTVLDVGQGDSLLLVSPQGHTILIDGGGSFPPPGQQEESRGPDPGEDAVSPYLWSRGFKQLDVVALTHAHQDHIGGLAAIFDNFKVKTLWIGREVASPQQERLETLAAAKGTKVLHELHGDRFDFDGAQGNFLWPQIVPSEVAPSAKNDDSLVFRVAFGQRSFLLPGDAEKMAEHNILAESDPQLLRSDVLKIGHHGSKNSTTPDFLGAVEPRLAVISSGEENPYGHPSPQLLDRLRNAEIPTLRTDINGAIHILTDGKNLEVSCFVACPEINAQISSPKPQTPDNQQASQ
jgi:competence protein ComEC